MAIKTTNSLGSIVISDEAIATLAGAAAIECYGIVGMASKRATDGLVELLKKENLSRGVKVTTTNNEIKIELYVIVDYGISMSAVAQNIIDTVKYNVEKYIKNSVSSVNVIVQGVRV